jgi:hypothetical protein
MERQESEARKSEIIRQMKRLMDDLGDLEDDASEDGADTANQRMLDFYIPRGLRNIHRPPRPML